MTPWHERWINKSELIARLGFAIRHRQGFAIGKLGYSEQLLLRYLPLLEEHPGFIQRQSLESVLKWHCEHQFGVFPTDPVFLEKFASFYTLKVRDIDILGVFEVARERAMLQQSQLQAAIIPFKDTEPDRSVPDNPSACYLPLLARQKLVFISPFAHLLKKRATQEIFESVWAKTHKKWFHPAGIEALEIPYSYGNSVATHQQFGTSIQLYAHICERLDAVDYDVAFLGVGALGLPLAAHIKAQGKVAISLGGHLQVLFGIKGARWNESQEWKSQYFNEAWIDMPQEYHPKDTAALTDNSAYW